jgi:competence protein ComEA
MRRTLIASVVTLVLVAAAQATGDIRQQSAGEPPKVTQPPAPPPLNLNTATAAQLEALPDVGPATAARIIEYRQKAGGFKKIEELMNIRGIGEKTFLKLKSLVAVVPPKTGER